MPAPQELVIDATTGRVRQAGAVQDEGPWVIQFRQKAEASLYVFTKAVLKRDLLSPRLHGWFCKSLEGHTPRRRMRLIPRGHLKSSIVSESLPMHMHIQPDPDQGTNIYWPGLSGDEMNILLCGEKKGLMAPHLRWIETQWESNQLLRALWPHRCWEVPSRDSKKWNEEEMMIPRKKDYADPSLRVIGVDGAITGAHVRVLIKDDLISIEAANSTITMQRAIEWHTASRALLAPFEDIGLEYIIGCLPGDADILLEDGTHKPLSQVEQGDRVWATDTDGSLQPRTVEAKIFQGVSETLTIQTASHNLRATPNHPFLARRKRHLEWVRADALKVGDFILAIKSIPGHLVHPWMTEDFFWLAGFLLGDGWIGGKDQRAYICVAMSKDESLNDRFMDLLRQWFPSSPFYLTPFGYVRSDNLPAVKGLRELGLSGGAKTKRVPDWVFQAPPEYRRAFLLGFCQADGCKLQRGFDTWNVEIANEGLIHDLRHVALLCGVRTGIVTHRSRLIKAPHSPKERLSQFWRSSFNFATTERCEAYHGAFQFKIDKGLRQERITRITKNTVAEPVYDLTVQGTPSFFANGLAVHNTRWAATDLYSHIINTDPSVQHATRSIIENGLPIWPEQITNAHIDGLRKEYGVLFALLYMNSAADPGLVDFDVKDLREYAWNQEGTVLLFSDDDRDAPLAARMVDPKPEETDNSLRGVKLTPEVMRQFTEGGRGEYFRFKAR